MITCKLCGHKARSLGKLTAHRFKEHPDEAKKLQRLQINNRKRSINGIPAKPEMTKSQVLDYLRGKIHMIEEIIADLERLG